MKSKKLLVILPVIYGFVAGGMSFILMDIGFNNSFFLGLAVLAISGIELGFKSKLW
jgi:hypothetical protein